MATVILVIHLILALAIILLVMLQRSEGGGLGIGGGGGGVGGLATAGQTANVLTRATAICAGLFFVTSLTLAVLAGSHRGTSVLDQLDSQATQSAPAENVDNVPDSVDSSAANDDKGLPKADVPADAENTPSGAPSAPISQ